ncbi:MAG TPA: NAD-dependent epimerase/dehydratase family protein [Ignavibacteria bacterium]|nr:NAD-dependent epimerase/dehydratase family protein [Ignavibacteria bacterium]
MTIKNKRILLTGGAGFIGSTIASRLAKDNKILIYDNFVRNSIQYKSFPAKNVMLVNGDILDAEKLKSAAEDFKPQIAVHLAAVAGVDTVIGNPIKTMEVNILGTFNFLRSLQKHSSILERVIDLSTSEVLGAYAYKSTEKSSTNFAAVGEARWTYSISKVAGEHLAYSYFKEYGYPCVTVRPFNIYGPGQIGEGAIHVFIKKAVLNKNIEVHGDGDQIRSWCYIDDMLEGILLCMTNKNAIGEIFNIGNPRGTITISSLAEKIVKLCPTKSKIKYIPKNYVDVELRIPSIDKAQQLLGYKPKVSLDDGIIRTFEWYKKWIKK